MRALADADEFDAIVTIFVPPLVTEAADVAAAISEAAQDRRQCTIAAVFMTGDGAPRAAGTRARSRCPATSFPRTPPGRWRWPRATVSGDRARRAASRSLDGCRPDEAAAIISQALTDGADWLAPEHVAALLDCYGLPLVSTRVVPDAAGAVAAARRRWALRSRSRRSPRACCTRATPAA